MTINNMKNVSKQEQTVIDFGEKNIPRQNYSRVITLDKKLLNACGCDVSPNSEIRAKIELVKDKKEDFIKVTPFCPNDAEPTEEKEP